MQSLLAMDARELLASRSYWLMLFALCALLAQAFTTSVALYAEASGVGGGPAALAQGLSPLEGFLVPTFGAYDLAATLLFPFVVIRLVAEERQTGAVWLQLQWPVSFGATMMSKGIVLMGAWIVALLPGVSSLLLWQHLGGHLCASETAGLLFGYVLRGFTAIGICAAAAALSSNAASAAVLALAFTIGTWALDYFAAARGGVLAVAANYTPWAALRSFERGEILPATIGILCVVSVAGLALAATTVPSGRAISRRIIRSAWVAVFAFLSCMAFAQIRFSADLSENRRNSFPKADEMVLRTIREPLRITVYLAAQDPRLNDLERGVLAKLRRSMKSVSVVYAASGRSGLFEKAGDHYGEIWYEIGTHRLMSRSTIEEVVLETVYEAAERTPPAPASEAAYPGYPLAAGTHATESNAAAWLFFAAWPLLIAIVWIGSRRKRVPRSG